MKKGTWILKNALILKKMCVSLFLKFGFTYKNLL
ncbi:hypothetical protein HPOKI112_05245 [Helicobacter pylori oki112]|nr:hypothetical protein HPOKI102_05200 [Helicobacter pylori oki102]AHN36986.1 hypothetical protein HPOKI112_05245 [Helicobacter pylori oki112]AHN41287.1 hypothetical protein HPOKI422_05230 [Helicobacter pylori oki422]AHN45657.1 hypothetical protein HPOKI898_05215 [Helicobacter pylori oki898]EQD92921.1 hypothetical protein L932_07900 [Helicobacter pylori PZ5026]